MQIHIYHASPRVRGKLYIEVVLIRGQRGTLRACVLFIT